MAVRSHHHRSLFQRVLRYSYRHRIARKALLAILLGLIGVYCQERQREALFLNDNIDLHHMLNHAVEDHDNHSISRCFDADDRRHDRLPPTTCACPDPQQASARTTWEWAAHHRRLVEAATFDNGSAETVFLGDSVTEHWNGTRRLGTVKLPGEYRETFDESYPRGLALGASGDTAPQLLWHLQHGMLPDTMNPHVFVVLIGTNELGNQGCSKRTVLAGILSVVQYLHSERPRAKIIIHGLLPRGGGYSQERTHILGSYWEDIVWINGELARICQLPVHQGKWYYFSAGSIFIEDKSVSKEMMSDALHPSIEGHRRWAKQLRNETQSLALTRVRVQGKDSE